MSNEPRPSPDLAAELARLRSLLAEREDLAAMVGHELRNPLHGLALQLALARLTAQAHGHLETETRIAQAQTMLSRYTDRAGVLLDLSLGGGAGYPLAPKAVDLSLLIRSVLDGLAAEAQHWGVAVELGAPPALPAWTDPLAVEQVVQNLLLNAFKHAAAARVRVSVDAVDAVDAGAHATPRARITIADDGRGIAEADRDRIFRKFGVSTAAPRGAGTGLGLWIVRTLLDALGGSVKLDSAAGAGSVFTVQFPLRCLRPSPPASTP